MIANTKSKLPIIIAIAGLALAFVMGWLVGRKPSDASAAAGGYTEFAQAEETEGETIWTCSMHPQVRQPAPGLCPICGMDLIPVAVDNGADDDAEPPRLRVSERAAALMNVRTWPVERRAVENEVRLLGSVNLDETRRRVITAWIPGRLDRLFVNIEGATVRRGDPIAEIYSPVLISAQEELLQALRAARARNMEDDPIILAARERLRLLGLGAEQVREIEERGTVKDHIVIHSPLDGVIAQRIAVEGTFVQAGDQIAALAALDRVFVDLEAFERDLPWLAVGQAVRFTVEGMPGESFEGRIDQINPFVDQRRRTARARVSVENPTGRLKPGMFARGVVAAIIGDPDGIEPWRDQPPLVIPATAALITGRRAVVYVRAPDADRPTFELRQVTLGPRAGEYLVVRDGLSEGELVVTHGNFKIDSELQLRGRPSMMSPPAEPEPSPGIAPCCPSLAASPADVPSPGRVADLRDAPIPVIDPLLAPAEFGARIARVVRHYMDLSEHLATDNLSGSLSAASQMVAALGEAEMELLSGEARENWALIRERMEEALAGMLTAGDIQGVRVMLQPLTSALEVAIVSYHAGQVEPIYRAYCPMAFNDRGGTWLQAGPEVRNAYFGATMFRCGVVLGRLP